MNYDEFSGAAVQLDTSMELDNLYPAIVQCFAVILCGYTAGRLGVISNNEVKGLNTFVGTFALPAVIFTSLVRLDLSSVNWTFIAAIFVAKALLFFCVIIVTCLLPGSMNMARAGIYAIFTTQTNDYALGVPIVSALYAKIHPEFLSYIYLVAPVNLTILNPFGFVFLEVHKSRTLSTGQMGRTNAYIAFNVVRNIVTNPIVFMSMLGMACNFTSHHNPPELLFSILDVFAKAFTATALFLLGLRMVGKVQTLHGTALIVPGILIGIKLIVVPLVFRQVVYNFLTIFPTAFSTNGTASVESYSTFAFLYGTVPSAPGVFVYATSYNIDVELIASSMVACTFLSAPIMFVSARLISLSRFKREDYEKELTLFNTDICLVSLFTCVWLITSFLCQRNSRSRHILNKIVNFLVISRIFAILSYLSEQYFHQYSIKFVERGFDVFGEFATIITIPCLAVAVLLTAGHKFSLLLSLKSYFYMLYLGIPLAYYVLSLVMYADPEKDSVNMFHFSVYNMCLFLALLVTIICLIMTQRHTSKFNPEAPNMALGNSSPDTRERAALTPNIFVNDVSTNDTQYVDMVNDAEEAEKQDSVLQHVVLLILLCVSMFISLACGVWYYELPNDFTGNTFVEMYFVENALRFGMPILIFCVFAVDTKNIFTPFVNRIIEIFNKEDRIQLVPWDQLSFETRHVCDQFIGHHLRKCKMDIARDIRWKLIQYKQSFSGSQLVDWIMDNDISQDRERAVEYAQHLVQGRVIRHIQGTYAFQDSAQKLFTFVPSANSRLR